MKHTPKTIKRALKRCINEISEHPEMFAKNPEKDFTRMRKLPFKQVLKSVLSMTGKSIRSELMEYFNLNPSMPTVSAFIQQRNKVDYRAYETLFHTFTNAVTNKLYSRVTVCLPLTDRISTRQQTKRSRNLITKERTVKNRTIYST